jgi:hypothetical protein
MGLLLARITLEVSETRPRRALNALCASDPA